MPCRPNRFLGCLLGLCLLATGCEEPLTQPPPEPAIDSAEAVVAALVRAYQQRDPDLLGSILANDADNNAAYLFLLSEPTETGETQWKYAEEARIHKRMFHPEKPPPGDRPVPAEVWLQSLSIALTQNESFSERPDLYTQNGGADGKLDPALWRATDATYAADLFFDLAGDTDYLVECIANFVVIENLQKNEGNTGKFLLFIWEDIDASKPLPSLGAASLGLIKQLYR